MRTEAALLAGVLGAFMAALVGASALTSSDTRAAATGRAAARRSPGASEAVTETASAYLPALGVEGVPDRPPFPDPDLADGVWRALERFVETYPPEQVYPGYPLYGESPTSAGVELNLQRACGDFPDLPEQFGPGAHRAACYQWAADYLSLYHTARAYRAAQSGDNARGDLEWARAYFAANLDRTAEFVLGAEDLPGEASYRDSLAAVYQNPLRAVDLAIVVDMLRKLDSLPSEEAERAEDLLSGIARAWYHSIWQTGVQPSTGVTLTTRTSEHALAYSLAGHQVMPSRSYTFSWDADKGNTPAEEAAWQGAGVLLAAHALGSRLADGEALAVAGSHFVEYSIAYDRFDRLRGGPVRTLNSETSSGPYGQNRYWIENHAPDIPSIPYLGATWHFIGTALLTDSDVPIFDARDEDVWQVLQLSAERTLNAPDGTLLIDLAAGNGVGYAMDEFAEWTMPCGVGQAGRLYVRAGANPDGSGRYVSEIGHPAGFDVLMASSPLLELSAERRDADTYDLWRERLRLVADEYAARAPELDTIECKVAPYVSDNPGYHWARMAATYVVPYLALSGYQLESWY